MTELSEKILSDYQTRKTKKQKTAFIEFMGQQFPQMKVEQAGFFKSRNLIIGDVENADVIFTAHYDTCARLPFPNFIAPKNLIATILYSILICVPFFVFTTALCILLIEITSKFLLSYWISVIAMVIAFYFIMFGGRPNKNTANDNTSGVIVLVELLLSLPEEDMKKAAFVFFDNEENGLLGSGAFRKVHKQAMGGKLLINFDCVSDGDNIMLVCTKKALKKYGNALKKTFLSTDEKRILIEKSMTTLYPSDQMGFSHGVGVAAMKKMPIIGYYLDRIHTKHDTVMDNRNIDLLRSASENLLKSFDD